MIAGGLVAGLAVSAGVLALQRDPATTDLSAQAQALPSVIAAPPPVRAQRASRGAGRTVLPVVPTKVVTRTVPTGASFSGEASWYGGFFQGRTTASGERFDTSELTAASKTLPFGTRLRVCRGERCVVVRVNDRGPYVGGRVLDLSRAAAQQLGYSGVAYVTATPVGVRTLTVVDEAAVAQQRAAAHRAAVVRRKAAAHQAAVTRRQAAHATEAALLAQQARLQAAAQDGPLPDAWPALVAAGLVAVGAGGLLRARTRRTRL